MAKKNLAIIRYLKGLFSRLKRNEPVDLSEELRKADLPDDCGNFSDGYHTFNDLYDQRMYLSMALCNMNPTICWKSRFDENGKPWFNGKWFLLNFSTPKGPYSYHYKMDVWSLFNCTELEKALPYDGHTSSDVERLASLMLPDCTWAAKEVDLCKKDHLAKATTHDEVSEARYVNNCLDSALHMYRVFAGFAHSGTSAGLTLSLLNRLVNHKPFVAIAGGPDEWRHSHITESGTDVYQNTRYSGLFKEVDALGNVTYSDVNRWIFKNIRSGLTYHNGFLTSEMDKIAGPITLPYWPKQPEIVHMDEFLLDPDKGDYDHQVLFRNVDGKQQRYCYAEIDGAMARISEEQYDADREKAVKLGYEKPLEEALEGM